MDRCIKQVHDDFGVGFHRCIRKAVTEAGYCRQHDPELRAAKDASRSLTKTERQSVLYERFLVLLNAVVTDKAVAEDLRKLAGWGFADYLSGSWAGCSFVGTSVGRRVGSTSAPKRCTSCGPNGDVKRNRPLKFDQEPTDRSSMTRTKEIELLTDVVKMLASFTLHKTDRPTNYSYAQLGTQSTYVLQVAGVVYFITANGGEFMVEKVNSGELARPVFLTYFDRQLNAATVANRVATVLCGEAIDYEYELTDEDDAILRGTDPGLRRIFL